MPRLVAFLALCLVAADKPPARPLGTWSRDSGEATLSMTFKADTFVIKVAKGDKGLTIEGSYSTTKDGLLFAAITKVDPDTLDFGPAKGDLFSFDFRVDKDEMTISDLRGTKGGDEAKRHVEGAYAKKK